MDKNEFSRIRNYLGRTQNQLAQLLSISTKAVESFEEGWRNIPAHVQRQLLLLLYLKNSDGKEFTPCWEIRKCPSKWRNSCIVWEYKSNYLCWFINGTFCRGKNQDEWSKKIEICRQCKVFQSIFKTLIPTDKDLKATKKLASKRVRNI